MITFTCPGKQVSTNAAYRKRGRGYGMFLTPEAKLWTHRMVLAARLARRGAGAISGDVDVTIVYHFDSRRPDADGPTKLVLDVLEEAGIVVNDRQVRRYQVRKELDKDQPRTEVTVRAFNQVELVATPEQLCNAWDHVHEHGAIPRPG